MLKTKNLLYKLLLLLALLLLAVGGAANGVTVFRGGAVLERVSAALGLLAVLAAAYYVFRGYSKHAAKAYKAFIGLFALHHLSMVLGLGVTSQVNVQLILEAITFWLILLLFLAKDLGKTGSLILCAATLLLSLVALGLEAAVPEEEVVLGVLRLGRATARMALAWLLLLMTYAKYLDKAERGTK